MNALHFVKLHLKSLIWAMLALVAIALTSKTSKAQDFLLFNDGTIREVRIKEDHLENIIYLFDEEWINVSKSEISRYVLANHKSNQVDIALKDSLGKTFYGKLLFVDIENIYLWNGTKNYNPSSGGFISIPFNGVSAISLHKNGSFKRGFRTGAIIGGGLGLLSGSFAGGFITGSTGGDILLLGAIQAAAAGLIGGVFGASSGSQIQFDHFSSDRLPEIWDRLVKNSMLRTPPLTLNGALSTKYDWSEKNSASFREASGIERSKIGVSFSTGFEVMSALRHTTKKSLSESGQAGNVDWFWGGVTKYPVNENEAWSNSFVLDYSYRLNSRIGIEYSWTSEFGSRGIYGAIETGGRRSIELNHIFIPKPFVPLRTGKWESTLGAGLSMNLLNVHAKNTNTGVESSFSGNKVGVTGHFSGDFYFTKNFSFTTKLAGRIIPSLQIPDQPDLKEHKVNFSSLTWTFGFTFHL